MNCGKGNEVVKRSMSITGCVFSGLLSAYFGLQPTAGRVGVEVAREHFRTLRRLGFQGSELQCDEYLLQKGLIEQFKCEFGGGGVRYV